MQGELSFAHLKPDITVDVHDWSESPEVAIKIGGVWFFLSKAQALNLRKELEVVNNDN